MLQVVEGCGTLRNVADYSMCRGLGHAWHLYDSNWKSQLGVPFTVRCERCAMERRDTLAPSDGRVIARHYTYPLGYRYARGQTPTRNDFRLILLAKVREERKSRNKERLRAVK